MLIGYLNNYYLLLLSTCYLIYVAIVSYKTQHNRCNCIFRILQCNEGVKLRMRALLSTRVNNIYTQQPLDT